MRARDVVTGKRPGELDFTGLDRTQNSRVPCVCNLSNRMDWVTLGPAIGDTPGELRAYDAGAGRTIAVARLADGTLAAFDDTCTHEECSLSQGDVEGPWIVCMCHNAAFETATGAVVRGPAEDPIHTYPVRVLDGELQIQI